MLAYLCTYIYRMLVGLVATSAAPWTEQIVAFFRVSTTRVSVTDRSGVWSKTRTPW